MEPLGYPLGVVHPIDAERHDGRPDRFADLLCLRHGVRVAREAIELVKLDPKRARLHADAVLADLERLGRLVPFRSEEHFGARHEVMDIAPDVKPDQVGPQHPFDDLGSPGKHPKGVPRGKRDVPEERDAPCGAHATQERRHKGEVVVLDEKRIAGAGLGASGLGEARVHLAVALILTGFEIAAPEEVVA